VKTLELKETIIKWGSYFSLEESFLGAGHCPYRLPLLSPCLRCSIGCCLCVRFACVVSALFRRMSIERKEPALNGSVPRQLSSVWELKGLYCGCKSRCAHFPFFAGFATWRWSSSLVSEGYFLKPLTGRKNEKNIYNSSCRDKLPQAQHQRSGPCQLSLYPGSRTLASLAPQNAKTLQ
jgi:hypothetical protein